MCTHAGARGSQQQPAVYAGGGNDDTFFITGIAVRTRAGANGGQQQPAVYAGGEDDDTGVGGDEGSSDDDDLFRCVDANAGVGLSLFLSM